MDPNITRIIRIIDCYNVDRDKIRIFGSIYSFYKAINALNIDGDFMKKYDFFLIKALKSNVEYFNNVGSNDYRVFMKRFLTIIKNHIGSQITSIRSTINSAEEEMNKVAQPLPYIAEVNSLNVPFRKKAKVLILTNDYMSELYDKLDKYVLSDTTKIILDYNISIAVESVNMKTTSKEYTELLKNFAYKTLSNDKMFSTLNYKNNTLSGFARTLTKEEKLLWKKMQLLIIVGIDVTDLNNTLIKRELLSKNSLENIITLQQKLKDYYINIVKRHSF